MKMFCKDLKDHAKRIINHKKKSIIPLTKDEEGSYNKGTICHIYLKEFDNDKDKVRDYCYFTGRWRGAAHNDCSLRHKIPKNIPIVFHNGSMYDYHFLIKELAEEFDGNFECLGENMEKYITFSVPIKKRIENKNMDINYRLKFIDIFRFMSTSLSKLVDNLTDGVHNDKCVNCKSNLCFVRTINETLLFECVVCKKEYEKKFDKVLLERFSNTYEFCGNDMDKFLILLRKGVYPYEYMDGWDRFSEKALAEKDSFYSSLTMEDISKTDYVHANNVLKKFGMNNLVIIMTFM